MTYKNLFFIVLTFVIIVAAGIFLIRGENTASDGNPSGNAQVVKLSVEGGRYVLSPSEFKKDVPVRIEADMSKMPGCSRSIVISAFNVRKSFTNNDNTIEFTPDKAGSFNIACSMNMYRGVFTVV